ncbi:tRNA (guanine(9)-N(1))-methyltransferase [Malassezia obtusa]|uniref:tRNA (guanine(9)-N1)-methyltransferase n=1 Tax=Malassezia obtusa TaxID=76774 RepID=A0AAF0E041_9BASI|nr:tRNA (guanine(9)-N(1))-methyltransferase [Malassezia obtusa]
MEEDEAASSVPVEQRRKVPPVVITDPHTGKQVEKTKTAAKKLLKRAQRQEKKEATKHERRAKERQRRKDRRRELREKRAKDPDAYAPVPKPRAVPFHARVVVDLGFDDLMTADEATSLAAQLGYLYGVNRTSSHPFEELVFTGAGRTSSASLGFAPPHGGAHAFPTAGTSDTSLFHDRVGAHMEDKNRGSWRRWSRVKLREYGGLEALWESSDAPCQKSDLVYLTADTDETIDTLEEGKTYIIGGIVDRNRYKHLCAKKAEALGIPTARLPIDIEHLGQQMNARKVLTVNQVFAILVGWTETRDWKDALQRGLPSRKFQSHDAEATADSANDEATEAPESPESPADAPDSATPPTLPE